MERVQLEGALGVGDGLGGAPRDRQEVGEVRVGVGGAGIELEGPTPFRFRAGPVTSSTAIGLLESRSLSVSPDTSSIAM